MTDKPLLRPRQATVSGALIIIGSVLIVLLAFQQVATLGSIEAQQSAARLISTSPGSGLGLSIDDVQRLLRVLSFVAAAVGTATAILGWQALQRSRSARLALSLLAPVLFVSGLAPAGFSAMLVAAAIAMLWVQPTRDWFAGREPVARVMPTVPSSASAPASIAPPSPDQSAWDIAAPQKSSSTPSAPTPNAYPYGAPGAARAPGAPARPAKVTAACTVAIIGSGLAFAASLVALLFVLGSRAELVSEIEKELDAASYGSVTAESLATVMGWFFAVVMLWALIATMLAVATMRRSNVARIMLVVSAIMAALVSLVGVLVVAPLAFTAAGIATVVLLLGSDARAWFAAPSDPPR